MKRGLRVANLSGGDKLMAGLAFLHRLALPPEVAATLIVVVALLAVIRDLGWRLWLNRTGGFSRQGF